MVNDDPIRPQFERRAGNAIAFLTSLVAHVSLMLLLACWVFTAGKRSQGLLFSAQLAESSATSLDLVQTFDIVPQFDESSTSVVEPELSIEIDADHLMGGISDPDKPGVAATFASITAGNVADGLEAQGGGRGANFFGSYAEGNRFVYVLDSSRSMTGDRWTYACNQLIDSLNSLKRGQEFFVICFDLQTSFLFNVHPNQVEFFEADKQTVLRVRRWLRSRQLGRATMPAQALRVALELNPDAIFLLSDGELQDNSRAMLLRLNGFASERRQIPIHTIHLFSPQGRRTLETIALENSGTFTRVDGR